MEKLTTLGELAVKYGTDKGPADHIYTPKYEIYLENYRDFEFNFLENISNACIIYYDYLNYYLKLFKAGISILSRGGILLMASCSSRIKQHDFFRMLENSARFYYMNNSLLSNIWGSIPQWKNLL